MNDPQAINRLVHHLAGVALPEAERALLDELLAEARERAAACAAARSAGLVAGATPLTGALAGAGDQFRRGFSPVARAIVGNVPPRR